MTIMCFLLDECHDFVLGDIVTLLGDDRPEYHMGDRVVVTQGPFKGAEGHIKRIKKDRRLVVTIPGVVAVATAYIPPDFLKKID